MDQEQRREAIQRLEETLRELRNRLEPAFSEETAAQGFSGEGPSTGQCAATSVVAREILGGEFLSTKIDKQSHWFNRLHVDNGAVDVDMTGDQFGRPAVQVGKPSELYEPTYERSPDEVNLETLERAILLAERASMDEVADRLRKIRENRVSGELELEVGG